LNLYQTVEVCARANELDWERIYPLAGPLYVEEAEFGDALEIEILDIHTKGWGWSAIIPGI